MTARVDWLLYANNREKLALWKCFSLKVGVYHLTMEFYRKLYFGVVILEVEFNLALIESSLQFQCVQLLTVFCLKELNYVDFLFRIWVIKVWHQTYLSHFTAFVLVHFITMTLINVQNILVTEDLHFKYYLSQFLLLSTRKFSI